MAVIRNPFATLVSTNKPPSVATFKNSLRSWQAQWKAQKAEQGSASKEVEALLPKEAQA